MHRAQKITQAYSLTPWRKQLQGIGLFLAVLVICALIAGIYLNVTARAATIGRQIQKDHIKSIALEQDIANKQAQLAFLTSSVEMERRALEMGFRPANSNEILYLAVPGYGGRSQAVLAPVSQNFVPSTLPLSPAFTQSLLDWIRQKMSLPPASIGNVKP